MIHTLPRRRERNIVGFAERRLDVIKLRNTEQVIYYYLISITRCFILQLAVQYIVYIPIIQEYTTATVRVCTRG